MQTWSLDKQSEVNSILAQNNLLTIEDRAHRNGIMGSKLVKISEFYLFTPHSIRSRLFPLLKQFSKEMSLMLRQNK